MPLDAAPPDSLYGIDVPTIDELAYAFIVEGLDIDEAEAEHSERSEYLFFAALRQAERVWTAKNVSDIPVSAFRKAIEERGGKPLDKATAYNLLAFWDKRAPIIEECKKEQAAAKKNGEPYVWRGWYQLLAKRLGRKPRDEFPTDAGGLTKTLIVDDLQARLTASEERTQAAEQRNAELQEKLKNQWRGRMGHHRAGENGNDDRPTPPHIVDYVRRIHDPDWDCCASAENTIVPGRFFDKKQDALTTKWRFRCGFMSPPFTAKAIPAFFNKGIAEIQAGHCDKVLALVPAWTQTKWFVELASLGHIEFIQGDVKFENTKGNAPWPLMLVTVTAESVGNADKLSARIISIPRLKPTTARKRFAQPESEPGPVSTTKPECDRQTVERHIGVATTPNVLADIAAHATPKAKPNAAPEPAPEPKSKPYIGPSLMFGGIRPCPKTSVKMGRQPSTDTHPDDPLATGWQIDGDRLPDIGSLFEHYTDKAKAQAALRRYAKKLGIVPSVQELAPDYSD